MEKQTHTNHTHTQSEQLKITQNGTHINDMLHEKITPNNREDSSQTNGEVNNAQNVSDNNMPFYKTLRKVVRGVMHTSEQDMGE